jgi:hypothetical protein
MKNITLLVKYKNSLNQTLFKKPKAHFNSFSCMLLLACSCKKCVNVSPRISMLLHLSSSLLWLSAWRSCSTAEIDTFYHLWDLARIYIFTLSCKFFYKINMWWWSAWWKHVVFEKITINKSCVKRNTHCYLCNSLHTMGWIVSECQINTQLCFWGFLSVMNFTLTNCCVFFYNPSIFFHKK